MEETMTNDEKPVRAVIENWATGLKKEAGAWTIVHEHHSVPTIEERFIGPGSK
jgi:hypothetical protein